MALWRIQHTSFDRTQGSAQKMTQEDLPWVLSAPATFRDLVTADLYIKGVYSGNRRSDDHKREMLKAHKREMLKAGATQAGIDWFFNGEKS